MATARTAALAIGNIVTLATVPGNKKLKMTSMTIDNQGPAAHTIFLRDDFTTDASDGAAAAAQTILRGQWTVGTLLTGAIPEEELKSKEFFGTLRCYADGAEPLCIITIDYEFI